MRWADTGMLLERTCEMLRMAEADREGDIGERMPVVGQQALRLVDTTRDDILVRCLAGALGKSTDEMTGAHPGQRGKVGQDNGFPEDEQNNQQFQ